MIDENRLIEVIEDEILRVNTESTPGCGNLYGRDASVMKNTLNFVIDCTVCPKTFKTDTKSR